MARPSRFEHHRWLGDKRNQLVHDLDGDVDECAIDDIMRAETFICFGPDTLPEARNRCYRPCARCVDEDEADEGGAAA